MTAHSQNGWSANDRSCIASYTLPGGGKVALRKGDVSVVLLWVANEFHRHVEPLVWPGNWGYAERAIRGSSRTLSNHASGTAIDLNAPKHPLGRRGTFTAKQAATIREIVADCEGVVRWGGDYKTRADEMHFEVNAGAAEVRRIADRIRAGYAARSAQSAPQTFAPTKDADMLDNIPVRGSGTIRRILPVGRASAVIARAWVSLVADGPAGAKAHVWFQHDGGGIRDQAIEAIYRDGWSSRAWVEAPDGTTQVNIRYDAPDGAVIALEGQHR